MSGPAGTQAYERFAAAVDRFVVWVEKDRLPLFGIFLYVIAVSVIRDISEYLLLDQTFVDTAHPWVFSIAHHVAFYSVVFIGLVFLLSAFSGRGVKRTINYVSMFYWMIILPPWIDHFIGGLNQNYAYFSVTDFLNAILHFSGEGFHIGQGMEVVVILFALFAYSIWTQRDKLVTLAERSRTVLRIGLLIFFTFLALFIVATPGTFLPVGFVEDIPEFPSFADVRYYQFHLFLLFYYLVAGAVLILAVSSFALREKLLDVVKSMRPAQTVFFGAIVAAGIVTGWKGAASLDLVSKILERPYWVNLCFAGLAIVAAVVAWQVSTIWNDLSDKDSDRPNRSGRSLASGLVDPALLWNISLVLIFVAVAISLLLSFEQALIISAIILMGAAYSLKPIRFKEHLLSPLLIGLGTFLAFLYGYFTPFSVVGGPVPYLTGAVSFPQLDADGLLIGMFMFLGLVIGSMVTDIDGYEEDRKAGVRTIYTSIGLEKGKRLVSALVLIGGLMPLFLFDQTLDLVVFPILAAIAFVVFLRKGGSRPVLLIALIGLAYAAVRYLGLLSFT
jgi:4-hydroxybenzoate polyprenyltransferase